MELREVFGKLLPESRVYLTAAQRDALNGVELGCDDVADDFILEKQELIFPSL